MGAKFDLALPVLTLALLALGLVAVSSVASSGEFQRQILGIGLALIPLGLAWWLGRERLFKLAPLLYAVALGLQGLTLVIGRDINGARNWLVLGPVQFQPLEILKLALILMLARTLRGGYRGLGSYLPIAVLTLPALLLVGREDLGGAFVLAGIVVCMMLVWRMPLWHFLLGVLVVGVAFPTVVYPRLKAYQQTRLTIFLDPSKDARGQGYQLNQSIIAIGSGGMMGKGYKQGTQTQNNFLPEEQTDFIFSSYSEEQGFVGAIALLILFGALFWRLAFMAGESPLLRDQLIFAGVMGQIGVQALENIGAALSLLPLTGITLPLISYGSSSLISTLTTLGVAYVVYRDRYEGMI